MVRSQSSISYLLVDNEKESCRGARARHSSHTQIPSNSLPLSFPWPFPLQSHLSSPILLSFPTNIDANGLSKWHSSKTGKREKQRECYARTRLRIRNWMPLGSSWWRIIMMCYPRIRTGDWCYSKREWKKETCIWHWDWIPWETKTKEKEKESSLLSEPVHHTTYGDPWSSKGGKNCRLDPWESVMTKLGEREY